LMKNSRLQKSYIEFSKGLRAPKSTRQVQSIFSSYKQKRSTNAKTMCRGRAFNLT